ncbi:MAG: anaerobic sulfatase-maturation protein [Candidatus Hydrogenedentes bacterium]|nr:anaerobic sulfatase-maturation protein [Candidatus Hydrogenedentota bacterium]
MSAESRRVSSAFHVMTKPTGPICNLDCTYCFYLEKEKLYPNDSGWAMSDDTLESYIQQYIEAQDVPEIQFAWQGGEPTILGVGFFERAVELQKRYANGKRINNAFQTNGILLDDRWGEFLAQNGFLVGISIDGPQELHDAYRRDKGGRGTFDKVLRGIDTLKKHRVEFNTLTCVNRKNSYHPLEVYRFLKSVGSGFIQFIPIVERIAEVTDEDQLVLVSPDYPDKATVSRWSVEPLQYGKFLSAVFDEWVRNDVGETFVQIFDVALEAWVGYDPSLCVFAERCGTAMALEHNGDLYSCDHFVYPENRLGNIMEQGIRALVDSEQQKQFGNDKADALPQYCRSCDVRFVCHGECPKHRFIKTPDGESGLNYLCAGYKHFFTHIAPYMQFMANELRMSRPPANVRRFAAQRDLQMSGKQGAGPNDPCPCGSGRKFKKCCGGAR